MRTVIKIFGLLMLIILFSCEELSITDCSECFDEKPTRVSLKIIVGGTVESYTSLLTIYEGNIEENIIVYSGLISNYSDFQFSVPLNKTFTAKATYTYDDKVYSAIDSTRPRLVLDEESCDQPCYIIRDFKLNLKMRYY